MRQLSGCIIQSTNNIHQPFIFFISRSPDLAVSVHFILLQASGEARLEDGPPRSPFLPLFVPHSTNTSPPHHHQTTPHQSSRLHIFASFCFFPFTFYRSFSRDSKPAYEYIIMIFTMLPGRLLHSEEFIRLIKPKRLRKKAVQMIIIYGRRIFLTKSTTEPKVARFADVLRRIFGMEDKKPMFLSNNELYKLFETWFLQYVPFYYSYRSKRQDLGYY